MTKETVFRAMFHIAFTDEFTLRLYKNELDGCNDKIFSDDFMVDIFFVSSPRDGHTVPTSIKKPRERTTRNADEEEEEKVDRELLDKYKPHIEHSADEDEDLDDYFQRLESK